MSYGITPFAVMLSRAEQSFGSGDETLARQILDEFGDRFEQDDTDPDDEDEPTLEQALHDMISGSPMRENYGHKYGYVLEMLCWHFGEHLPNGHWTGMHSSWADDVDLGLATAGVPEERLRLVNHLMYRGSPVEIPEPDDFPSIGYLLSPEVGPALAALETANLDPLDPDVRDAITEVRGWLEACSRSGCDLVCFYY